MLQAEQRLHVRHILPTTGYPLQVGCAGPDEPSPVSVQLEARQDAVLLRGNQVSP